MIHLLISISMLGLAPAIYLGAAHFRKAWKFIENIIIIVVTCLVVLHLLPESIRFTGASAVGLAFVGLFLPSILERLWRHGAGKIHFISLLLSLGGLIVHGMLDGAALAVPHAPLGASSQSNSLLQLAVVLHRLPAALFIWGVFYPKRGPLFASLLLVTLGLATIAGFLAGEQILTLVRLRGDLVFHFQALVAGSLLHIAFDRHEHPDEDAHPHQHGIEP